MTEGEHVYKVLRAPRPRTTRDNQHRNTVEAGA